MTMVIVHDAVFIHNGNYYALKIAIIIILYYIVVLKSHEVERLCLAECIIYH